MVTVNPATLPNGVVGSPYSQTVSATGGNAPYTFTVSSGALPTGLILNPMTGLISGTPNAAGTFTFTITATDANGCPGSRAYTIVITGPGCPVVTVNPPTLPPGVIGTPYSQTITATGGNAPYTFTVTAGALPNGLILNGANGIISGTPLTAGQFNFTITATDVNGCQGSRPYSIVIPVVVVCPFITVSPAILPNGVLGSPYSQTVTATGGIAPYIFSLSSGSLPTGLILNSTTGIISGTPTAAGTFTFTVTATDVNNCPGSRTYTIVIPVVAVCPFITVNPPIMPNGVIGTPYSQTVTATGGIAPYTFTLSNGALPTGLILNSTTGIISGTPTTAGTFTFTITATDANNCPGSRTYTIVIPVVAVCPFITVNPPTLPAPVFGQFYSQTITATGGVTPYTFTVSAGALPSGLTLNATTGVISGIPTSIGPFSFVITATDANGCPGIRAYAFGILAPVHINIPTLSQSGLMALMLLLLAASATVLMGRSKAA